MPLFMILFGLMSSCKSKSTTMETFEWRPTACAPKFFPAEIATGNFIFDDETSIYIPGSRVMHNGWGNWGAAHIVGEDFKPIPVKLEITWLSFTENKFYSGTFKLPQKEMKTLFERGFTNWTGQKKEFTKLNVGLAPKGAVTLWIQGIGWSEEIAQFQAQEVSYPMKKLKPHAGEISQEQYVKNRLGGLPDDIKQGISANLNFDTWSTLYQTKYKWLPKLSFADEGSLQEILVESYNGENYNVKSINPILQQYENSAPPRHIRIKWTDKNQLKYGAKIFFDEAETFGAFRQLFDENKATKARLNIKIDKNNSNISIFLMNENEKIPLTNTQIKVYSMK